MCSDFLARCPRSVWVNETPGTGRMKNNLGIPNSEELKGKYEAAKGVVKERVGQVIADKEMEHRGAAERDAGDVRSQVGKIKRKPGEAIEDVGTSIRK